MKKLLMLKTLLAPILAVMGLAISVGGAHAQDGYPSRPVTIVVPFPGGGGVDVATRLVTHALAAAHGYHFIVENKPGSGGILGSMQVAKAQPDGYTFLVGTSGTHGINSAVYPKLPYDPLKDFVPVGMICDNTMVLVANQNFPANDLQSAISLLRANPGKYSYATPGIGTAQQLAMELLKHDAGIDVIHVPYKGSPPALADVVSGRVALMVTGLVPTKPFLKSGKLKVLAVINEKRSDAIPDIPTLSEFYPGLKVHGWFGLLAPAGTPASIVDKVNHDLNSVLADAKLAKSLESTGFVPEPMTAEAFGKLIQSDIPMWRNAAALAQVHM